MQKLISDPQWNKNLAISTCHITAADDAILSQNDETNPICTYNTPYGYFVFASQADFNQNLPQFSQAFIDIMKFAVTQGVDYVHFDCDAITYDDIPTFDW